MSRRQIITDANQAVASVAYRTHDVIPVYPVTPATPMAEHCDLWAEEGRANLWGETPEVTMLHSPSGVAGALRGASLGGALTTTFTASEGLVAMLGDLHRMAGELSPAVIHVAARAVAGHATSIGGDHSDVMTVRSSGWAMLAASSPQEAQDFAAVALAATLRTRIPFLHFFDGFHTSHEIAKITELTDADLAAMVDEDLLRAHRARALRPERPSIRGTAQGGDVFFQAREATQPYYEACPGLAGEIFERFAKLTGRRYRAFDYYGHPEAERVLVLMGSAADTARATVERQAADGVAVGLVQVRLFRPFDGAALVAALPKATRAVATLDRCKEAGAPGEPLYLDVLAALNSAGARRHKAPDLIGGRYGLGGKEFTPDQAAAVLAELAAETPRNSFTVGIIDDVGGSSLEVAGTAGPVPGESVKSAVFSGGAGDGTLRVARSILEILGDEDEFAVQGRFVFDSRKAGAVTEAHLRFGPTPDSGPLRAPYPIEEADFVICQRYDLIERHPVLRRAAPGAVFLLDAPHGPEEIWDRLPREVQEEILEKNLRFFVVDARQAAREAHQKGDVEPIFQAAFFALAEVLPNEDAIPRVKRALEASYARRGPVVLQMKLAAVDHALAHLHPVTVPAEAQATRHRRPLIPADAPDWAHRVTALMLAGRGDALPVSAFPADGAWPLGSGRYEARGLAPAIPVWESDVCIQCNQCALACPHAAIRPKLFDPEKLAEAPEGFRAVASQTPDFAGLSYTLQVLPDDCTGCQLCVEVCPAKDRSRPRRKAINMESLPPLGEPSKRRDEDREFARFFHTLAEIERPRIRHLDAEGSQYFEPLFEASGACPGCGETPYVKLLTQLFGDRLLITNPPGCAAVFGLSLPTTPYSANAAGHGPAVTSTAASGAAESGLGLRLAVDSQTRQAQELLIELAHPLGESLVEEILSAEDGGEQTLLEQRRRIVELRQRLAEVDSPAARRLDALADLLVPKSIWVVGGDGWAHDTGYGGLIHVLSGRRDVNVLVLDNETHANTGGQATKATPLGAVGKFAIPGKETPKHDLGLELIRDGGVYVARVAFGANMHQTVDALREADAFPGPSIVLAYSHCVAHGYDLALGPFQQRQAVAAGLWPLYRFDPRRAANGEGTRASDEPALHLDSPPPGERVADCLRAEARFRLLEKREPERFKRFVAEAQRQAEERHALYRRLAEAAGENVGATLST